MRYLILYIFSAIFLVIGCSDKENIIREYVNDKLKKEYRINDKGNKDGLYLEYYTNGNISTIAYYNDGFLEGNKTIYYKTGNIQSITNYDSNRIEGKRIFFNQKGGLHEIFTYKKDTLNGLIHTFYNNGMLRSISFRKDTLINGSQYQYYKTGNLKVYSYIVKNKPRYYKMYDSFGNLIKENGLIIPEIKQRSSTLNFKFIDPPCSMLNIVFFELNQEDTVKTYEGIDPKELVYTVKDSTKNLKIIAKLKDLQTGKTHKVINFIKPPSAKDYSDLKNPNNSVIE